MNFICFPVNKAFLECDYTFPDWWLVRATYVVDEWFFSHFMAV